MAANWVSAPDTKAWRIEQGVERRERLLVLRDGGEPGGVLALRYADHEARTRP
jgi:hypothetical protein